MMMKRSKNSFLIFHIYFLFLHPSELYKKKNIHIYISDINNDKYIGD